MRGRGRAVYKATGSKRGGQHGTIPAVSVRASNSPSQMNPFATTSSNGTSSPSTPRQANNVNSRGAKTSRFATRGGRGSIKSQGKVLPAVEDGSSSRGSIPTKQAGTNGASLPADKRLQLLKQRRLVETQQSIKNGTMADPDVKRHISEAITLIGTCQDMCPEYERVTRMVQNDVWAQEYTVESANLPYGQQIVDEKRMVKKFRRPAAGIEEQIPSDLRPPSILRRTVDYLMNDVIGSTDSFESLRDVHAFVWDRTRGVRNDFSVQQVKDVDGLRTAIDCFERIVRFHLLTRHQIGGRQPKSGGPYNHQQDLEQCDKGLISLLAYYDQARLKGYISPNEPEFRAYWIITRIPEKPQQDVESRVQRWPIEVQKDQKIRVAIELYAAACNASNPRTSEQVVAQQNYQRFFDLVQSGRTSYLMACAAEIFFDVVRKGALFTITRSYNRGQGRSVTEWSLDRLCNPLGFDSEDEVMEYLKTHQLPLKQTTDGSWYLDISLGKSTSFNQIAEIRPPNVQSFSESLVEFKRYRRSLPAIINGLNVQQASQQGLLEDVEVSEMDQFLGEEEQEEAEEESLFVPLSKGNAALSDSASAFGKLSNETEVGSNLNPTASPFLNPFGQKPASTPAPAPDNPFAQAVKTTIASPFSVIKSNPFASATSMSSFSNGELGHSIFSKAISATPTTRTLSPFGSPATESAAPAFQFTTQSPVVNKDNASNTPKPPAVEVTQSTTTVATSTPSIAPSPFAPSLPAMSETSPEPAAIPSTSDLPYPTLATPAIATSNPFLSSGKPISPIEPIKQSSARAGDTTPAVRSSSNPFGLSVSAANTPVFSFGLPMSTEDSASIASPTAVNLSNAVALDKNSLFDPHQTAIQDKSFTPGNSTASPAAASILESFSRSQSLQPSNPSIQQPLPPAKFRASEPQEPLNSLLAGAITSVPQVPSPPAASNKSSSGKQVSFDATTDASAKASNQEKQPKKSILKVSVLSSPDSTAWTTNLEATPVKAQSSAENRSSQTRSNEAITAGPTPRQKRYNDCADYLAREVLLDPKHGFLYQYIAFSMQSHYTEIKTRVDTQKAEALASQYRRTSLIKKYGAFWRQATRYNRKKRAAGQRRQRMLEASTRRSTATKEANAKSQSIRAGYPTSMRELGDAAAHASQLLKDRNQARKVRFEQSQSQPASYSGNSENQVPLRSEDSEAHRQSVRHHRRSQTQSAIMTPTSTTSNQRNIETMPSTATNPLRHSAGSKFLHGDQLQASYGSGRSGRLSTFSSNYFKLKARGLAHLTNAYQERTSRKRLRDSTGEEPMLLRLRDSLSNSRSLSPQHMPGSGFSSPTSSIHGPTVTAKRKASFMESSVQKRTATEKCSKEDDELFARARAVQKALGEGISVYQAEIQELQKSESGQNSMNGRGLGDSTGPSFLNSSVISFASPPPLSHIPDSRKSLADSFRSSKQADIIDKARDKLPAYWFRESKFVPRSEYGLGPRQKRPKTDESTENEFDADRMRGKSALPPSSRPASSMSNDKANYLDMAQGALSQPTNGFAAYAEDHDDDFTDQFGQGQPTGDGNNELLFDEFATNGDGHPEMTGQEYDEDFLHQPSDTEEDVADNGSGEGEYANAAGEYDDDEEAEEKRSDANEEEEGEEQYEEGYTDEEGEGYYDESEESDDGGSHMAPSHHQGGSSAEDAIEL